MSSDNCSDPGAPGLKHHGGHGHLKKRIGLDIDFRYLNNHGISFKNQTATSSSNFNDIYNQTIYNVAADYGFTVNYQGLQGTKLDNASRLSGHNNHGHLGLNYNNLNWKYVNTAPRN